MDFIGFVGVDLLVDLKRQVFGWDKYEMVGGFRREGLITLGPVVMVNCERKFLNRVRNFLLNKDMKRKF